MLADYRNLKDQLGRRRWIGRAKLFCFVKKKQRLIHNSIGLGNGRVHQATQVALSHLVHWPGEPMPLALRRICVGCVCSSRVGAGPIPVLMAENYVKNEQKIYRKSKGEKRVKKEIFSDRYTLCKTDDLREYCTGRASAPWFDV